MTENQIVSAKNDNRLLLSKTVPRQVWDRDRKRALARDILGLLAWNNYSLQWRHNKRDVVSNYRPLDYLLHCLFRRRWKKISKLRLTGLCEGNPPVAGGFPSQRASNGGNVSIWWHYHGESPCTKTDPSNIERHSSNMPNPISVRVLPSSPFLPFSIRTPFVCRV